MNALRKPKPSHRKGSQAQAVIEFVLIVPVMVILLLGLIDVGRAFVFGVSVQEGAREAARLAERANTDTTVTDAAVLSRLIAASNPALIGCTATLGTQAACGGGGTWTLSINITTPNGTNYTNVAAAKTDANFPGSQLTVTAVGSVSMLSGIRTIWGMGLYPVTVQGQASMEVM